MLVTFLRTVIIFITLAVVIRVMGKRQIGEMQPFEFLVTLIIADLACVPMSDVSIPLTYGIVSILALFLLHQILSLFEQSGSVCKRIISGKPSLVINKNGVDVLELKRNNMGVEDLIESMRNAGYFSLDDLDYAIFESNGKLSAFESTVKKEQPTSIPIIIINEGRVVSKNLSLMKVDKDYLSAYLKSNGKTLKSTEVMTVDGNGRTYYKEKGKKFEIREFPLKKEIQW